MCVLTQFHNAKFQSYDDTCHQRAAESPVELAANVTVVLLSAWHVFLVTWRHEANSKSEANGTMKKHFNMKWVGDEQKEDKNDN